MLRHGSLFSGIGGFDLAAEWMGWENIFHCEYDPFCQKILKHHFPNSKLYEDIKTFKATKYRGRIDILTGGFPCQPFSNAGLRKGTEDERNLWGEMLRIIREVSPSYVVGENVRGLLNWSGGVQFEQVCADLEAEGYEVTPYLLPACGKNAPHRRDRIWFVAYSDNFRNSRRPDTNKKESRKSRVRQSNQVHISKKSNTIRGISSDTDNDGHKTNGGKVKETNGISKLNRSEVGSRVSNGTSLSRDAPNTNSKLSKRGYDNREDGRSEQTERIESFNKPRSWEEFPTQPPLCGGDDGLPKELDGITFPKWRKESIKAYGNAIVPQVAHEIFKAIQKMEDTFVP